MGITGFLLAGFGKGTPASADALTYNSPAEILQQYLVDVSLVIQPVDVNSIWPAFIGHLPDGAKIPIDVLVVYNTSPKLDGRMMKSGEVIKHPGLQFRVRSAQYNTGWNKLDSIAQHLDRMKNQTVIIGNSPTYTIQAVSKVGGIIDLGRDGKSRHGFTLNVTCTINFPNAYSSGYSSGYA